MMISDLPSYLESEILSRVPAKSLVVLQTTCKRWYFLFKDPKFAEKNLGKSTSEVFLLKNFNVFSICVNLYGIHNGIDPSIDFRGKFSTLNDYEDFKISEIFHCDGLILCLTKENTRLVVWNPCIGETRWIKPKSCNRNYDLYALGYGTNNSSCRSYKILRLCRYYSHNKIRVDGTEIYEFSSDSWRVLDVDTHDWDITSKHGASLKENAYWVAFDKETGFFLLHFDFTTERFERLPLPCESHIRVGHAVLSVVKGERLSLLYQNLFIFLRVMKIWMTNKIVDTKEMSWSNFLVVDLQKFMLPSVMEVISFFLDEENKVAVCCDTDTEDDPDMEDGSGTKMYIVGEDIYKEVYKEIANGTLSHSPLLVNYVPSLVRILAKENELD